MPSAFEYDPMVTPAGPSIVVPPAVAKGFAVAPVAPVPGAIPYQTALPPAAEVQFQKWVATNKIPFDPSPTADYDMRGYWQAMQAGDKRAAQGSNAHFPDVWKTPYHDTFSNESIYATPLAPHWLDGKLVDYKGNVLVDENPPVQPSTNDIYMQSLRGGSDSVHYNHHAPPVTSGNVRYTKAGAK